MLPKILVLSTLDKFGAGLYALELHKLLVDAGYSSRMYVKEKSSDRSDVFAFRRTFFHKVVDRVYRILSPSRNIKTRPVYHFYGHLQSSRFPTCKTIKNQVGFTPDVVLVLWVADFVSNRVIQRLHEKYKAKIVFIPPDAALFTGGCHYPNGCENYKLGCMECPAIINSNDKKVALQVYQDKLQVLRNTQATVVSVSSYLTRMAKEGGITKNTKLWKQYVIVDEEEFYPISKRDAAENLGLDGYKTYILLAAAFLKQKRKGIKEAIIALNIVWSKFSDFEVLLLGNSSEEFEQLYDGRIRALGYMDPIHLNDLYNIAHLYMCPSLEDAGPMMVNQSLMTGTPVVGFKVGVLSDLVIDDKTGFISETGDIKSLAESTLKLLHMSADRYQLMAEHCRALALDNYSKSAILNNFQALMQELKLKS